MSQLPTKDPQPPTPRPPVVLPRRGPLVLAPRPPVVPGPDEYWVHWQVADEEWAAWRAYLRSRNRWHTFWLQKVVGGGGVALGVTLAVGAGIILAQYDNFISRCGLIL